MFEGYLNCIKLSVYVAHFWTNMTNYLVKNGKQIFGKNVTFCVIFGKISENK